MRNTVCYIAMSLDGYLADANGKVDWLMGQDEKNDYDSYGSFVQGIDTVIMGWKTYHQIITELSPNQWVYEGLQCYVITHRESSVSPSITLTSENPCDLIRRLRHKSGKDIWINGGASIVHQLMQADMIDRYHIAIIPTILGNGIRLFQPLSKQLPLKLVQQISYNGIVECIYERRKEEKL